MRFYADYIKNCWLIISSNLMVNCLINRGLFKARRHPQHPWNVDNFYFSALSNISRGEIPQNHLTGLCSKCSVQQVNLPISIKGRAILIKAELPSLQRCRIPGKGWCSPKAVPAPLWWHQTRAAAPNLPGSKRWSRLWHSFLWGLGCLRGTGSLYFERENISQRAWSDRITGDGLDGILGMNYSI